MRAMVLSRGSRVTRIRNAAWVLIAPAKTASPTPRVCGTLSPVTGLSSMPLVPSMMSPSAGMRSPGRIRTTCPIVRLSAGTVRVPPDCSSIAVLGTRSASARMPWRARPAATPSRTSPTANRNTTSAASSAAPISSAPPAAMVIRLSIVKGWPMRSAATARQATGATPIRQAATNAAYPPPAGVSSATTQASASSSPVSTTSRPLAVRYHDGSAPVAGRTACSGTSSTATVGAMP